MIENSCAINEDPVVFAKRNTKVLIFQLPMGIVDGANTVIDPLFDGISTGKHWCGKCSKRKIGTPFHDK